MTYKTRKHIWPLAALMSLAVFGVLAAVVALSVGSAQVAQAHPCDTGTIQERAQCDTEHENDGLDSTDPNHQHPTVTNNPPTVTMALGDMSLRIGQPPVAVDISGTFEDADDDTLSYSASSNNQRVANATIAGSQMTVVAGDTRGTAEITVTADDGNGGTASDMFMVTVAEAYTLTADPMRDAMLPDPATPDPYAALRALSADAIFVVIDLGAYDAKFHLAVAGSADDVTVTVTASEPDGGGITITDSDGLIGAGFNQDNDLEGSLTVKSTDQGSRAFEIEGACERAGVWADILVEDKDLNAVAMGAIYCKAPDEPPPPPDRTDVSDVMTVASYDDWMYHDVTDGYVVTDAAGNPHLVNAHPTIVTGWLDRDEPVIHANYTLGVSTEEMLGNMADGTPRRAKEDPNDLLTRQEKNAYVEEGQRTVEVLVGAPHVQLTVTSRVAGPAYIRFLDSDMQAFGDSDMDEDPRWSGADVVGLDSQGRLALNVAIEDMSEAMALAYDQYEIITPGIVPGQRPANSYLRGADGDYNQGTFRFFNPCPSVGHNFYVEVYESTGKYLQTTEKVVCINPPGIVPSELSVTTFSDRPGDAELRWREAIGSTAHHVIVLDMTDPMRPLPVAGSYSRIAAPVTVSNITGLSEGVEYRFAVVGERRDVSGSITYSMPSFIDQIMDWE